MTEHQREDEDLPQLFERARRAEAGWTPSFERVRRGNLGARSRRGWWLIPALVAAVALTVVLVRPRSPETPEWLRITVGQLRTPTDFLLEVNGADNLKTIPSIGSSEGWFPLSGKSSKENHL